MTRLPARPAQARLWRSASALLLGSGCALLLSSGCALLLSSGCTVHHSKQALAPEPAQGPPPSDSAHFITEEDSGLSLFGLFVLAEPDHYAVLLERLRRDHRCARLSYPQLDFYTDHWLLIAFPIARITSLCEPEPAPGAVILPLPASPPAPAPEPP